jgi:hypothetical protein
MEFVRGRKVLLTITTLVMARQSFRAVPELAAGDRLPSLSLPQ